MPKLLRLVVTLLAFAICISDSAFAATSADNARTVAQEALQVYKGLPGWEKFNFQSGDELQNADLGESLPVFAFDAASLASGAGTVVPYMVTFAEQY